VVTWIVVGAVALGLVILALVVRPVLVRLVRLRRAVRQMLSRQAELEALMVASEALRDRLQAVQTQTELAQRTVAVVRARRSGD
jgi:hypothetical protein